MFFLLKKKWLADTFSGKCLLDAAMLGFLF